jgi:hypothetical protein
MIDAMPAILKCRPDAVYVVLGATHLNLVRHQGEAYRARWPTASGSERRWVQLPTGTRGSCWRTGKACWYPLTTAHLSGQKSLAC